MGVTKVTIIDSPEKMRARNMGYSIIIPQVRAEPSVRKTRRRGDLKDQIDKPQALNHQLVRLAIPAKALKRRV
jgi:hypothetical protein